MGKVVVVEDDRLEETYQILGPWDEDIGHERYSELLQEGRVRDVGYVNFDGNMLRLHDQLLGGVPIKNDTIFRCFCPPEHVGCRICFMRKRTIFAEGQAAKARLELKEAKSQLALLKHQKSQLERRLAISEIDSAEYKEHLATNVTEKRDLKKSLKEAETKIEKMKVYYAAGYEKHLETLASSQRQTSQEDDTLDAIVVDRGGQNFKLKPIDLEDLEDLEGSEDLENDSDVDEVIEHPPKETGSEESETDEELDEDGDGENSESSDGSSDASPAVDRDADSDTDDHESGGSRSEGKRPTYGDRDEQYDDSDENTYGRDDSNDSDDDCDDDFRPDSETKGHGTSAGPSQGSVPSSSTSKPHFKRRSNNSANAVLDCHALGQPTSGVHFNQQRSIVGTSQPRQQMSDARGHMANPQPSRKRKADNTTTGPVKKGRGGAWSDFEKASLIEVVRAHVNAVQAGQRSEVHDVRLWIILRDDLRRVYNVDRGAQACRMTWNRGLRESSGIDERLHKDPTQMATSLQTAKRTPVGP